MEAPFYVSEKETLKNNSALEIFLADEIILNIKTREFYWNVSKDNFLEIQKLFQYQHIVLEKIIDSIGLQIGKLESRTIGTIREYSQLTRLKESANKYPTQVEMLRELLNDHAFILKNHNKNIEDQDTNSSTTENNDFFKGVLEKHEIMEWILRVYLKKYSNVCV